MTNDYRHRCLLKEEKSIKFSFFFFFLVLVLVIGIREWFKNLTRPKNDVVCHICYGFEYLLLPILMMMIMLTMMLMPSTTTITDTADFVGNWFQKVMHMQKKVSWLVEFCFEVRQKLTLIELSIRTINQNISILRFFFVFVCWNRFFALILPIFKGNSKKNLFLTKI